MNETKRQSLRALLGLLYLASPAAAFVGPQQEHEVDEATLRAASMQYEYRLSPGDVIRIRFHYNQELDETVTIRPDGRVALLWVGTLQASELTPEELGERLTEAYSRYVRRPELTVLVEGFAEQVIFVGGEVNAPGVIPLKGQLTGLRAVFTAGGVRSTGKLRSVLLVRRQGYEATLVGKIDLQAVMNGEAEDIPLQPYDVVYVPRSNIAKVGVFVDQWINAIIPRNFFFQYNLTEFVAFR